MRPRARRARPTRSTSCRRPPATPKARFASTSTRTPTRSSRARWRWCGRPARKLDAAEQLLAELFFANLAGDATTNLYRLFIDSRSRRLDIGARSVGSDGRRVRRPPGRDRAQRRAPGGDDRRRPARDPRAGGRRDRSASRRFADGSPELKEFNERIASRVAERERQALKFLGTPPGFGARSGSSAWVDLLLQLERSPGDAQVAGAQARVRARAAGAARLRPQRLARGPGAVEGHRRHALRRRRAAQPRADRARAGRARGAPRRGDRAAEAPLRHDRRAGGAGALRRRRRRRAGGASTRRPRCRRRRSSSRRR